MKCRICNNSEKNLPFKVKEMMYGFRDEFTYFQCNACECLQLLDVPEDMAKYYPLGYHGPINVATNFFKKIKYYRKGLRINYAIFNKGLLGKLLHKTHPEDFYRLFNNIGLTENSSILDVGCGSGWILYDLAFAGFKNLIGIDPYIEKDMEYENKVKIFKRSIQEINGSFDLILFNHSFEHDPQPRETMKSVSSFLKPAGVCLLRIPIMPCFAWEHYKENWVQIDAPRHIFLHSLKSLEILARETNLRLEKIIYDSTDLQFWGSEQYQKGIPLFSSRSYGKNRKNSIFSEAEIESFKERAATLNRENRGDQATIYLRKN